MEFSPVHAACNANLIEKTWHSKKSSSRTEQFFQPCIDVEVTKGIPEIMNMFQSDQDPSEKGTSPTVPDSGRAVISRKLRELYDAVQDEGIPDKFLDLLEKLDEAENNAKASRR
jgi:hypothetical protein